MQLLGDFSNLFRLLYSYLLLFGVAICHQAHRFHFDEKIGVSQNPIQNSKFSVKRKNHGQQESANRGWEPQRQAATAAVDDFLFKLTKLQ